MANFDEILCESRYGEEGFNTFNGGATKGKNNNKEYTHVLPILTN